MSRNKLIVTAGLAVVVITMMTSNQLTIYASPTTEDDGYTYPDDASEEEKEEIDEREQEAWEDAGRPGEDNNNDDDHNDNDDGSYESPMIENAPAPAPVVNESRWYRNCMAGGEGAGHKLDFNVLDYQSCENNANGDKAYYDGFIQGCMLEGANTKDLCETFIVECLRSTDPLETCDVRVDTTT
jgi:hypothetical protein